MTGLLVALGTVAVAMVIGFLVRSLGGRTRPSTAGAVPDELRRVLAPGAAVTLVQLTTEFCGTCGQARVLLTGLVDDTPGLAHAEVDLTDQPELAKRLGVLRTPTTIAVDAAGAELLRVGGVPKREELLTSLRPHLPA
ncbi:thioredoxin family protein [Actinokineospora globicatena]|uniref:Thiol reductase thioredoxin n=1 Tax=Actinokineospora globicatena TaxID=103729 RepID=A0A9W6V8J1_9PSEU|nr:thioredoxin family protein [Actinokineospora globicatena]MCP2301521.1 Thioredoxin [Actinokineospora globicatena]GLW76832.1 thiol reductase thioredoxin [Actinokineospora globicatena]GLW83665.1 thiol reductase thioredoxin [Actinokineospora globicatena]GLW92387.1 thiol reductase thioredoxin [Actinokineospora globicatena]